MPDRQQKLGNYVQVNKRQLLLNSILFRSTTRGETQALRFPHILLSAQESMLGDGKGTTYQAGNVSLAGSSPVEKEDIIDVTHDERREETAF